MRGIKKTHDIIFKFLYQSTLDRKQSLNASSPDFWGKETGSKKIKALFLSRDRLEKYHPYH